ncbi:MAG: cellulase family glycosylhydrolase [Candidatus Latescibacterota bacterium]|nr:cellulase family glycosylhydrolase [Candidatus Latescibacterota bacterium]
MFDSRLIVGAGVNMDASVQGTDIKYQHQPEYFDLVRDAGFQTVRWFIDPSADPDHWQDMLNQAIERDLTVVVVLWADRNWNSKDFATYWQKFADYYQDYPRDKLIFELLNEPEGINLKDGSLSMEWINAAIPAIRKSNPDRILAIGGPGFNEAENLIQFVNPDYIDYRLEDGSGFEQDENIVGIFHMYLPYYFSHYHGSHLESGWTEIVTDKLQLAASWSKEWHKPVILTEWGAWGPPGNFEDDFYSYLKHIVNETARLDIEWIYYCGYMNNQWPFSLFDTDTGWDREALGILTGREANIPPPLSPLLNSEFNAGIRQWKTRGPVKISRVFTAGLSGDSALEIEFAENAQAAVYQENLGTELGRKEWTDGKRSLISLTKGSVYVISFLAKSVDNPGSIRIGLEERSTEKAIWSSETIGISIEPKQFEFNYTPSEDLDDLRFLISSESISHKFYIDRIQLKRL